MLRKIKQGRRLRRAKMKIRVAVLRKMLSKVIAEKVLFEEKPEEVREQEIWRKIISG